MIKYNAFPVHEDGNMYVTEVNFSDPKNVNPVVSQNRIGYDFKASALK